MAQEAPTTRAAAIWNLWSSQFHILIVLNPRWVDDQEPYSAMFGETPMEKEFVRLSKEEAHWLVSRKAQAPHE